MTESTDYVANGLYLIAAGIVLTCGFWFFRSERQVTRTVNALIRGRFTGYGEQDRAQMVKGMRLRPRSVSAWASSSYSWVSRLWSGDVTGDAVSYLSDYRRDAQTTCCVAVGGHPALGCVFCGVDSDPGDGQLILANAPSLRLTISFSVALPAKAKMEPKVPPAAGIIATTRMA